MENSGKHESNIMRNEKIAFIHILRGLAPILVLFAHIPGLWLLERGEVWDVFQLYKLTILAPMQISDGGGHLGVVIFFLISGYIISAVAEKETGLEFIVKRVLRIMPTLFVCTAISYFIITLSNHYSLGPIYGTNADKFSDFIKSALMLSWIIESPRAISVAWSLMPEIIFYFIVFMMMKTMRESPVRSLIYMLSIYALLTFPMKIVPYLNYLGHFTVYLPIFFIGRLLYIKEHNKLSDQKVLVLLLACSAIFVAVYNFRFPDELFRKDSGRIWNYIFGIIVFYGMMISNIKKCPRSISFLADISYALYLVHLPVGIFILNLTLLMPVPFFIKCLMAIGASVTIAFIIHIWVEKPAQKSARYLLKKLKHRDLNKEAYS